MHVMSETRKTLWGFGSIAPLVVPAPVLVLALSGFWLDNKHEGSYGVALAVWVFAFAVYLVTLICAFVHVARRTDLPDKSRRNWFLGLFFLNGFLLPVFWWRLIRPMGPST